MRKLFINAILVTAGKEIPNSWIAAENGIIVDLGTGDVPERFLSWDIFDVNGNYLCPGFIDNHCHGGGGHDFMDGTVEAILGAARAHMLNGTTTIAPTSLSSSDEELFAFIENCKAAMQVTENMPHIMGIHLEGPHFSPAQAGAQPPEYLKNPSVDFARKVIEAGEGTIIRWSIAPELPGAEEFVRRAKELCTVSIAHTDSDYDHAKAAIDAGVTHLTHLYNAMPPIHHRNPGVIPAVAENPNVRVELICDGLHAHPAMVRFAFSLFGGARMVLVSDSGRCCGMADGSRFELGGQDAWLRDGVARLADGTIACSATNLYDSMVNAIRFGIREEDAVRAASYNPACAIGADQLVGSIETGKVADFLVCSPDYTDRRVFLAGKEL
jgi:N-acetylglucosamine-6-phosphate deacetylase